MNRSVEIYRRNGRYTVKFECGSAPEAWAVQCAGLAVPPAQAFVPNAGMEQPNPGIAFDPPEVPRYPPNCDGNSSGMTLAQAQFEAAVDGDECTSGACLITRGSD